MTPQECVVQPGQRWERDGVQYRVEAVDCTRYGADCDVTLRGAYGLLQVLASAMCAGGSAWRRVS